MGLSPCPSPWLDKSKREQIKVGFFFPYGISVYSPVPLVTGHWTGCLNTISDTWGTAREFSSVPQPDQHHHPLKPVSSVASLPSQEAHTAQPSGPAPARVNSGWPLGLAVLCCAVLRCAALHCCGWTVFVGPRELLRAFPGSQAAQGPELWRPLSPRQPQALLCLLCVTPNVSAGHHVRLSWVCVWLEGRLLRVYIFSCFLSLSLSLSLHPSLSPSLFAMSLIGST